VAVCMRKDDHRHPVKPSYCANLDKPDDRVNYCNAQPCPPKSVFIPQFITASLPRDVMLARYMLWPYVCPSVRPSVCPSQVDAVSERLSV